MKTKTCFARNMSATVLALVAMLGTLPVTAQPIPPEVEADTHQWPLPNRDYAATRAALDSDISSRNVNRLALAWAFPIPRGSGNYGNAATGPLILGDTVYLPDLDCNIHAVDRLTGDLRWQRRYTSSVVDPNGVAVGWGKVFGAAARRTSWRSMARRASNCGRAISRGLPARPL
jgi:glucose dehydrogenase